MSDAKLPVLYTEDDDDEETRSDPRQQCVDCATWSPKTTTEQTLISARYGWRLERIPMGDDTRRFEWRCPACWQSRRATLAARPGLEDR